MLIHVYATPSFSEIIIELQAAPQSHLPGQRVTFDLDDDEDPEAAMDSKQPVMQLMTGRG